MRLAIGTATLVIAIFLALVIEEVVPPLPGMHGARLILVPALFAYGAVALPLWVSMPLALYAGFLQDLSELHIVSGQVEISLGWSMVYFVVFGLLCYGFQPSFVKRRWWVSIPLAAFGTSLFLALQFVMISVRREGFVFEEAVLWRILAPGVLASGVAGLIHLIASQGALFLPESAREEGKGWARS